MKNLLREWGKKIVRRNDMKLKEVSPEMKERIKKMMNKTWNYIADDLLQEGDLPRSHVIEIVLDADYCLSYGDDKEAYDTLMKLSYEDMKKIGKEVFVCKKYGL